MIMWLSNHVLADAGSSCGLHHSGEMQLLLEREFNGEILIGLHYRISDRIYVCMSMEV